MGTWAAIGKIRYFFGKNFQNAFFALNHLSQYKTAVWIFADLHFVHTNRPMHKIPRQKKVLDM